MSRMVRSMSLLSLGPNYRILPGGVRRGPRAGGRTGAGAVNFHDPRPQTAIIRPPVTELTAEITDQAVVKVGDGTLLMVPSWLPHSVDASGGD